MVLSSIHCTAKEGNLEQRHLQDLQCFCHRKTSAAGNYYGRLDYLLTYISVNQEYPWSYYSKA